MQLVVSRAFSKSEVISGWEALANEIEDENPFLSSLWMSTWLNQSPIENMIWLRVYQGDKCVSMAIFNISNQGGSLFSRRCGWLHKIGDNAHDQVWIEFNDILSLPKYRDGATSKILQWCSEQPVDTWKIELSTESAAWTNGSDFHHEVAQTPSFLVNLSARFSTCDEYLASLSKNTRGRIRRAMRYLTETYGEIRLVNFKQSPPPSVLEELTQLHKSRWDYTVQGSGFSNPLFVDFHQQLMLNSTPDSGIEVVGFYAGDFNLGYTYNLIRGKSCYFYLSGINYSDKSNKYLPGLIMHTQAIAHYASRGFGKYDFMGGDNQYKRSLANHEYPLYAITLLKRNWRSSCYLFFKNVRNSLKNLITKPVNAD